MKAIPITSPELLSSSEEQPSKEVHCVKLLSKWSDIFERNARVAKLGHMIISAI